MTKRKFITIAVDNSKRNGWRLEGKVRTDFRNYKDVEMFEKVIKWLFFFCFSMYNVFFLSHAGLQLPVPPLRDELLQDPQAALVLVAPPQAFLLLVGLLCHLAPGRLRTRLEAHPLRCPPGLTGPRPACPGRKVKLLHFKYLWTSCQEVRSWLLVSVCSPA